jgi:DNA repair protein SbcD/Mre11
MRPIKILHTGDVHLGARFSFLGSKGREHRQQLLSTFSRVVDLAITSQVDFFLITGDLFDSNFPSGSTLETLVGEVKRLGDEGIEVLLAPGTHDRLGKDSIYNEEVWDSLKHLHIFREPGWSQLRFKSHDVVFHGWGYGGRFEGDALKQLSSALEYKDTWQVGLLHGSLLRPGNVEDDDVSFTSFSIKTSILDYLALGHWHSFQDLSVGSRKACAYCGSPESLYLGEESGKVVLVTLARDQVEIKPIQVGKRSFLRREVDMHTISDRNRLKEHIKQWASRDTFLEVVLKGVSLCEDLVDAQGLEEELTPNFYGIRVRDESFLASITRTRDMPGGIISGEFLKIAEEKVEGVSGEDKRTMEEAMRLGLAYLEGRAEV